jgi:hypothetical protein
MLLVEENVGEKCKWILCGWVSHFLVVRAGGSAGLNRKHFCIGTYRQLILDPLQGGGEGARPDQQQ